MSIERVLSKYIVEECLNRTDGLELAPEEDLLGKGIIDSMQLLQLVQFIEERFEVTVADSDLVIDNFKTIRRLREYIETHQQAKPSE